MTKATVDYQALQAELETILQALETGDLDVDAAVGKYQRGQAIVAQLQAYLKSAATTVKKLQTKR